MKSLIAASACISCLTMGTAHASEHYTRMYVQQIIVSDETAVEPESDVDSLEALRQEKLEAIREQAALEAALDALFELPGVSN